ncbi:MAG: ABC transporter permease subunit, partial [Pollutimonas bauzanensis]
MSAGALRPVRKVGAPWLLLVPCLAFMAVFFVYPVLKILAFSVIGEAGTLSAENFARVVDNSVYVSVLATTFKIALLTTACVLLLGYPLAYGLYKISPSTRNNYLMWVLIPFWTSDLVKAFS